MSEKILIGMAFIILILLPLQVTSLSGNGSTVISGEVYPSRILLDYYYYPFLFPDTENILVWHYLSNESELLGNFSIRLDNVTTILNYSYYYGGYPASIYVPAGNVSYYDMMINASASSIGYRDANLASNLIVASVSQVIVKLYQNNLSKAYVNDDGWIFAYPADTMYSKARAFNANAMTLMQDFIIWQNNALSNGTLKVFEYPQYVYAAQYLKGKAVLALPNATQYTFVYTEGFYDVPTYYSKPTYTYKKNEQNLGQAYITADVERRFVIDQFALNFWGNVARYFILMAIFGTSLVVAFIAWYVTANPAPLFGWSLGIVPIMVLLNLLLKVILS